MFGFLRPRKPSAGETLAHLAKPRVETDAIFMGACVEHGLRGLGQNGKFQGAFAQLPMFHCQTMPDGIEVAGSKDMQTSAILAENVMTLATVGAAPLHWTSLAAGIYCKHAFGVEPDWQVEGDAVKGTLALGQSLEIEFTAKPCDHVDPMWTGEKQDGASLTMLARRVAPQGSPH